uniref:Patj homolog n=1 Tax=Cacopsylla melanoneura TaxID=428564 RepID=A0A8D8SWY8_9HEMI
MPLAMDISSALEVLEDVKQVSDNVSDMKLRTEMRADLKYLIGILENPIFGSIGTLQDSIDKLKDVVKEHPSITPIDIDIFPTGELSVSTTEELVFHTDDYDSPPEPQSPSDEPDQQVPNIQMNDSSSEHLSSQSLNLDTPCYQAITTPSYAAEFQRVIQEASCGREVIVVELSKPEAASLGFSVVGLSSEEKGQLGIFIQEITPNGIAGRDGRLHEGDQILAIDGQPLDGVISPQQAISILQQARGRVQIIVARIQEPPPSPTNLSVKSNDSCEMVLNTDWAQVESIHLVNDGSGLGFGIIGGRSTGVVVKTILPGGVADRDGHLQSGDHILQIGVVNLRGMGSEQVASVLRQSGSHVRLVVARPVEPTAPDFQSLDCEAPIVPTKLLNDPVELDRHLIQCGYPQVALNQSAQLDMSREDLSLLIPSLPLLTMDMIPADSLNHLPEMETFTVDLVKDSQGLGITIAGYVCEKEELSGIFVKSICEGSAADKCGQIAVNDRIVQVNDVSLQGYTNHQAVTVLRSTGERVTLKLERYLRGPKFEQLQIAIANSELKPPTPSSPARSLSVTSLPKFPTMDDEPTEIIIEPEADSTMFIEDLPSGMIVGNGMSPTNDVTDYGGRASSPGPVIDRDYAGPLSELTERAIQDKWRKMLGDEVDIIVAQISKSGEQGGLGISLEGTVDVEDGIEVRPHHYIRSILPEGPVGRNGRLQSGDELLEVNEHRLLGMNHIAVVTILKELPVNVRMVCARSERERSGLINTSQDKAAFAARNILGGSLQNLMPVMERLVKAKSDGSLASSCTTGSQAASSPLSKLKSRSLEPLTGLAMWSSEPQIIELTKGERGLGFSILDYQDPMNPNETVIVIRSLVPGGVAQLDARLIPGDRLLSVNDTDLNNASLDQAVQALKGAPRGVVRIGVAKPLPIPDSSCSQDLSGETLDDDDNSMYSCTESLSSLQEEVEIGAERKLSETKENLVEDESPKEDESVMSNEWVEALPDLIPPAPPDMEFQPVPVPSFYEHDVKIGRGSEPLGISVELREQGISISSIQDGGRFAKDGRIAVGDLLLVINHENIRKASTAQAQTVLRRTSLLSSEINVTFVKAGDIPEYKRSLQANESHPATPKLPVQISPRIFPQYYRSPYIQSEQSSFDESSRKNDAGSHLEIENINEPEDILVLSKLEEASELSKSTSHLTHHTTHRSERSSRHGTGRRRLTKSSEHILSGHEDSRKVNEGDIQIELTTRNELVRREHDEEVKKGDESKQYRGQCEEISNHQDQQDGVDVEIVNEKSRGSARVGKEQFKEKRRKSKDVSEGKSRSERTRRGLEENQGRAGEEKERESQDREREEERNRENRKDRLEDKENVETFHEDLEEQKEKHKKLKRLSIGERSNLLQEESSRESKRKCDKSDRSVASESSRSERRKHRDNQVPNQSLSKVEPNQSLIKLDKPQETCIDHPDLDKLDKPSEDTSKGRVKLDKVSDRPLGKPLETCIDLPEPSQKKSKVDAPLETCIDLPESVQTHKKSKEERKSKSSKSKHHHKQHHHSSIEAIQTGDHHSHKQHPVYGKDPVYGTGHSVEPPVYGRDPVYGTGHSVEPPVYGRDPIYGTGHFIEHPVYGRGLHQVAHQASFDFEFLDIGFQPENFPHAAQQQVIQDINVKYKESVKDRPGKSVKRERSLKERSEKSDKSFKKERRDKSETDKDYSDKTAEKAARKERRDKDRLRKDKTPKEDRVETAADEVGQKVNDISVESKSKSKSSREKRSRSKESFKLRTDDTKTDVQKLESKERNPESEVLDENLVKESKPKTEIKDTDEYFAKESSRHKSKERTSKEHRKQEDQHQISRTTYENTSDTNAVLSNEAVTSSLKSSETLPTSLNQQEVEDNRPKLVKCKLRDTREAAFSTSTSSKSAQNKSVEVLVDTTEKPSKPSPNLNKSANDLLDTTEKPSKPSPNLIKSANNLLDKKEEFTKSGSGQFLLRNEINYKLIKINKIKSDTNIKVNLNQDYLSVLERNNSKSTPNLLVDNEKNARNGHKDDHDTVVKEDRPHSTERTSKDKSDSPIGARIGTTNGSIRTVGSRSSVIDIHIVKPTDNELTVVDSSSNNLINFKEFKSEQKLISNLNDENKNTNCLNEFKYLGSFDLLDTIHVPGNVSKLYRYASTGVEIQEQDKLSNEDKLADSDESRPDEDRDRDSSSTESTLEEERDRDSSTLEEERDGDISNNNSRTETETRNKDSSSIVLLVEEQDLYEEEEDDMTVTASSSEGGGGAYTGGAMLKNWGAPYLVEIYRDKPNASLGISVVGGKVDVGDIGSGSGISGIFIKNVIAQSPAGQTGKLKTGDRILEVDNIDVRTSSHEQAVDIIRAAGNPVKLLIQSLIQWQSTETDDSAAPGASAASGYANLKKRSTRKRASAPGPPPLSPLPNSNSRENMVDGIGMSNSVASTSSSGNVAFNKQPSVSRGSLMSMKRGSVGSQEKLLSVPERKDKKVYSSDSENSSDEEEDTRDMEGKIKSKGGEEIMRASAANVKRSKEEIDADTEEEDKFGYTMNKVKKKYGSLGPDIVVVTVERSHTGLGISLAGHKDRTKMAVFVCGLNPSGAASKTGSVHVGDEVLEVNGIVLHGRCHLNASAIIKGLAGPVFKLILHRRQTGIEDLAVKPVTQFPVTLDDETPEEKYANFKGLRIVAIKKAQGQGLGIMIIEGKHAEVGKGIFISDIQEGSAAEQAGLIVGDMILAVNKDAILGNSYDSAASILKKSEGIVTLVVCNPNLKEGGAGTDGAAGKEKPKEEKPKEEKKLNVTFSDQHLPPSSHPQQKSHPQFSHPQQTNTTTTSSSISTSISASFFAAASNSSTKSASTAHPVAGTASHARQLATHQPQRTHYPRAKPGAAGGVSGALTSSSVKHKEPEEPPPDPATAQIVPGKEVLIEINRDKTPLGINIVGGNDTRVGGILVHDIFPEGGAAKDARLKFGDQILELTGEDFRNITNAKAMAHLRLTPAKVKILVLRDAVTKEDDLLEFVEAELTKKPGKGFGLSLVARKCGPGVFIADLVPGGLAATDGRLLKGDLIVGVDGTDLKEKSQEEVATLMKVTTGKVPIKVARLKAKPCPAPAAAAAPAGDKKK